MMTVKEVMKTDVATCAPGSDLADIARTMRDRDCGFLPVVDSHGIVVGVVTDRDVCLAVTKTRTPAHTVASDVMSRRVFACFADENMKTVLETMAKHRVRRLPVLDKAYGHLKGVLSLDDVLQAPQRRGSPTSDDIVDTLKRIHAHRAVETVTA
jgi:CBS domain-containing protein